MGKKRLADLGELAHVAQIFIGLNKNHAAGGGPVTRSEQTRLVQQMKRLTGATTVLKGRGEFTDARGQEFHEPSLVLTAVVHGTENCRKVHHATKRVAANAARLAGQSSVLAMTSCATGRTDADLIAPDGSVEQELPRLRAGAPRSRERKRKR